MERLNKEQSKLLKIINKEQTITYANLTEVQKSACDFLTSKQYVTIASVTKTDATNGIFQYWEDAESVSVTESGKAYLHNEHIDKYHVSVPDIINAILALVAIGISIAGILLRLQVKP